jgi:hypothetical protein
MSRSVFLALCILGTGFMTYAFFQWTYGDKRSTLTSQIAAHKKALWEQSHRPFLVHQGPFSVLASASSSTEAGRLISAQAAPSTNDSLEQYAKRFCDQGE